MLLKTTVKLCLCVLLLLATSSTVLADGVNKPKKKKRKTVSVKKTVPVKTPTPKLPSLLTTKYDLAIEPFIRPTLPLLEIPIEKIEPVRETFTTTETRVFEIEKGGKRRWAFLLIGLAAIPFLVPDDETPTIPVQPPTSTVPGGPTTSSVPEGSTFALLGLGVLGLVARRKRRKSCTTSSTSSKTH